MSIGLSQNKGGNWGETRFGKKLKLGENQSWTKTKVWWTLDVCGNQSWFEVKVLQKPKLSQH